MVIMEVVPQALARLGWVDTWFDRLWVRVARLFPKAVRMAAVSAVLLATVPANSQMATFDSFNLQEMLYEYSASGIRERIAQLWKESKDEARWVTDLVETYRAIKMARASYESLATFDLSQNVNVVDLLPQIDLPAGEYFGAGDTPWQDSNGNDHYVSLRFKLNPVGGISQTLDFSTLSKFQPKLRVNVDQLAQQLANLDFDALQMVQYRGPNGEMKGTPINVGKSVAERLGLWDNLLKGVNDWVGQKVKEQDTYNALQDQIALDARNFDLAAQDLKARADKEDAALQARLAGKDVPADLPSTYAMVYSPRIQLARQILAAQEASNKQQLDTLWSQLTAIKKMEEKRQAAVQGDAQVTEVLAQAAKIQQDMQTGFVKILDKYKVQRQDQGEKVGGGLLPSVSLTSADLENMKLPPQARDEVNRMMAAGMQALQVLQLKLQGQKYMADHLGTIDGVSKDLTDATNQLATAFQTRSSTELQNLNNTLKNLDRVRLDLWNAQEAQNRADDAARAQQVWNNFSDANQKYFGYMLTNKPMSAASLVENLVKNYMSLVKTFTTGRSLGDVMGPNSNSAQNDFQKEADLYNSF